jgi:predicted CopG family antitoxin
MSDSLLAELKVVAAREHRRLRDVMEKVKEQSRRAPRRATIRVVYVYERNPRMQKKLTVTVHEDVYDGLHRVIGRGKISQFIEDLVRPHVTAADLDNAYRLMAADEAREAEALEWAEATIGDIGDEAR